MALRKILIEGDETLRKKSRPITDFGKRTQDLMDDLRETMAAANGAGLAAPQVGILRRACVIINEEDVVELINPMILKMSEETEGEYEGCLSCPDKRGWLERPSQVTVKAQDRNGNWFELELEHMAARAACHESEHLDGVLFIDQVDEIISDAELADILLAEEAEAEQEAGQAAEGKN